MNRWAQPWKPLLSLLLAAACPLCERHQSGGASRSSQRVFCFDCERQLRRCHLARSQQVGQDVLPVFAWGEYGGALKQAIATLKYKAKPEVAQPLGFWLGEAWRQATSTQERQTVLPIPLHTQKQRQRGYNQAALLAEAFCQITNLPLAAEGLVRIRSTEAQFGLSIAAREQNLADAFAVNPAFARQHPTRVLLLDDIYTTGATVKAAATCLQRQGIAVEGVVVLARPSIAQRH